MVNWWLIGGHSVVIRWLIGGHSVVAKRRIFDENSMNFNFDVNFSNFCIITNGYTFSVTIHPIKVLLFIRVLKVP